MKTLFGTMPYTWLPHHTLANISSTWLPCHRLGYHAIIIILSFALVFGEVELQAFMVSLQAFMVM
jgi:hypothetical protein